MESISLLSLKIELDKLKNLITDLEEQVDENTQHIIELEKKLKKN